MNKSWFYLGVIGSLAILTTSCGGDSKPPTPVASPPAVTSPAASVPPATAPKPVATAATATAPATATPAATTTTAAVPAKSPVAVKPVSVDVAAGLIPTTDGNNWAKTVAKGRPDPFGMLAMQPVEVIEPIDPLTQTATAQQPAARLVSSIKSGVVKPSALPTIKVAANSTKTAKVSGKQRIASNAGTSSPQGTLAISAIPRTGINRALPKIKIATEAKLGASTKIAVAPNTKGVSTSKPVKAAMKSRSNNELPASKPVPALVAAKPEKVAEKPLQAMAIEISGVIEVGGQTQVIVKLPNESFSRYIEVGERVANGKVLVKRVEGQNSLSPTVVLEEVGVEVPHKIGENAAPTAPVVEAAPKTP
jgi:hypothetical protein